MPCPSQSSHLYSITGNIIVLYILIFKYHKIRERKAKTLPRNWRDHWRTGTWKHMETVLRYFNRHGRLYQSEESKSLWTHDKDGITREFMKSGTRGLREGWMERRQEYLNWIITWISFFKCTFDFFLNIILIVTKEPKYLKVFHRNYYLFWYAHFAIMNL
jgi:hypothetical protein